jgi:hypothetical protein
VAGGQGRTLPTPRFACHHSGDCQRVRADFGWQDERVQKVIRRIAAVAGTGLITPRTALNVVVADPDDNRILECAVDGKADTIVFERPPSPRPQNARRHSHCRRRGFPPDLGCEVIDSKHPLRPAAEEDHAEHRGADFDFETIVVLGNSIYERLATVPPGFPIQDTRLAGC